jgi:hypothetical protein
MLSFAFVPIFEILAFAVIWRTRISSADRLTRQWPVVASTFLDGNRPWLVWLLCATAMFAVVPPHSVGPWIRIAAFSTIVPIAWSFRTDVRFFRAVLSRSSGEAIADALIFRAIAWTLGLGYFLGIAIWAELGL